MTFSSPDPAAVTGFTARPGEGIPGRIRLLVVDDHEIVRQGLVALLERREPFQVVAQAGTRTEALELTRRFEPDLVLMDIRLPDGSGIEACRAIREAYPGIRVVFLTSSGSDRDVLAAILAGASGYVLKETRATELVETLSAVARGESRLDPAVTGPFLERIRRAAGGAATDEMALLTERERTILALVAEGHTNVQIAAEVFLSDKTVKNYVSSILKKLGLERRAQTAAFVARYEDGEDR